MPFPINLCIIILFTPIVSNAVLDSVAQKALDIAEGAMLAEAITDLANEVAPESQASEWAEEVDRGAQQVYRVTRDVKGLRSDVEDLQRFELSSKKSLYDNVRHTTQFIGRLKRTMVQLGASTKVAAAYGAVENSVALNQMVKNQNTMIGLMSYRQMQDEKRRIEDKAQMETFLTNQLGQTSKRKL